MAPSKLAAQLGMNVSHFKELRVWLQKVGLLERREARGARNDFWYPRLPEGFTDIPPTAKVGERREWVLEQAAQLDKHIEAGKTDPASHSEAGKSHDLRSDKPTLQGNLGTALPVAGDGKPDPIEHDSDLGSAPSVTLKSSETDKNTAATQHGRAAHASKAAFTRSMRATPKTHDLTSLDPATLDALERWERRRSSLDRP